jgi:hypothetical protein
MPNYYEVLKVQPSASQTEIETAYEAQYNQWRRLVTHHDPDVVNQANQALQALETIRTTLTDSTKRSIYDTAIGVSNATGGLADPMAALQRGPVGGPMMTPPAPRTMTQPAPAAPSAATTLWVCPQCGSDNPAETFHCFRCGTQLVRQCPECSNMTSLVATGFCGTCGYKYDTAVRRAELRAQMDKVKKEMSAISSTTPSSSDWTLWLLWGFGILAVFILYAQLATSGFLIILGTAGLLGLAYAVWQYLSGGDNIKELPGRMVSIAKEPRTIQNRIGSSPTAVPAWLWLVAALAFVLGLLLYRSIGAFPYHEGIIIRLLWIVIATAGVICLVLAFVRTRDARAQKDAANTAHTQAVDQKRNELRALEQEYQTLELRRTG